MMAKGRDLPRGSNTNVTNKVRILGGMLWYHYNEQSSYTWNNLQNTSKTNTSIVGQVIVYWILYKRIDEIWDVTSEVCLYT